jgi:hypothetical protein
MPIPAPDPALPRAAPKEQDTVALAIGRRKQSAARIPFQPEINTC